MQLVASLFFDGIKLNHVARDVVQLYAVKEKASYELHVALADGSSMPLLKKLPELNQALFIEQQIESALGIDDVGMPGEVGKD